MQRAMFFKKFLMPCGLCAAVPAMKPATPSEEHPTPCSNEMQEKKLIKPSDLPIYPTEDGYSKHLPCPQQHPSIVEENIRKVRQAVGEIKITVDKVSDEIFSNIEKLKYVVDYLQSEANFLPRIGAVGIGGLSGLILSLRGGMLKRLVYISTGAGTVSCLCFPKEAKEAINVVEHYGNIGYNFIFGVKPGDSKVEILNEFPLLKSVLESEYFRMLNPFDQKASNATTEKEEENPPAEKSEKKKE